MIISDLRCEYYRNPLGIDLPQPRLSWKLSSDRRGARQSAYQIVVESSGELLWDSGKIVSEQSTFIPYEGKALQSGQQVSWKVRTWDELGEPAPFSEAATWEMGLLERTEWIGEWIGSGVVGGPRTTAPVPYLRKEFHVEGEVASARLYVTALGVYQFEINGKVVGDEIFAPGWTDYRKRVQYQTFDVSGLLAPGTNAMGAMLGDGWYCGYVAALDRQQYGDRPRLLAQLSIRFQDGSTQVFATDSSWRWTTGPILESDFLMGESYDARKELGQWSASGYDDATWQPVVVFHDPGAKLVARVNPPVRRQEELVPIAEPKGIGGWVIKNWVFDLGQNMVGRVRLRIRGRRGLTVRLRFAEALNPDGSLYTASLRTARATDYYTLKGEGEEVYEPAFTFHGFRYVEVFGIDETPNRDMITGVVLHSDIAETGEFECSDPLVNQLQHNIQWGQKGNFLEVPTDCPQRDERLGWTGDAQVFARTATFNRDVLAFFAKWMDDMDDAQTAIGQIPPVVPNIDPFYLSRDGGPAWADAVVICPWTMHAAYGDQAILARHYATMKGFVDYLRHTCVDFIRVHPKTDWKDGNWQGFGDWLAQDGSGKTDGGTQKDLIGTAFFAYSAGLLADIARCLGKEDDHRLYSAVVEEVRKAFVRRYVTADGLVAGLTQTGYVLGLKFGLIPNALRQAAIEELVRDIEARGWHLSTGFVGTPYILQVLTDAGRLDVAYRLLLQDSWPSWLYSVTQGATTIWERWDGWTHDKGFQTPEMNSFNHYAYGAVGAWMVTTVAGIDIDLNQPGYRHILFKPQPGGGLTNARARLESVYGEVESAWRLEDEKLTWKVVVPANTTATAWVPGAEGKEVFESGRIATEADGVRFLRDEEGARVFALASGVYLFEVTV